MGREHVAPLLEKALSEISPEVIANGFKATGLYPFNVEKVDFSKCLDITEEYEEEEGEGENVTTEHETEDRDYEIARKIIIKEIGAETYKNVSEKKEGCHIMQKLVSHVDAKVKHNVSISSVEETTDEFPVEEVPTSSTPSPPAIRGSSTNSLPSIELQSSSPSPFIRLDMTSSPAVNEEPSTDSQLSTDSTLSSNFPPSTSSSAMCLDVDDPSTIVVDLPDVLSDFSFDYSEMDHFMKHGSLQQHGRAFLRTSIRKNPMQQQVKFQRIAPQVLAEEPCPQGGEPIHQASA